MVSEDIMSTEVLKAYVEKLKRDIDKQKGNPISEDQSTFYEGWEKGQQSIIDDIENLIKIFE